jgi:hypothetical protein
VLHVEAPGCEALDRGDDARGPAQTIPRGAGLLDGPTESSPHGRIFRGDPGIIPRDLLPAGFGSLAGLARPGFDRLASGYVPDADLARAWAC